SLPAPSSPSSGIRLSSTRTFPPPSPTRTPSSPRSSPPSPASSSSPSSPALRPNRTLHRSPTDLLSGEVSGGLLFVCHPQRGSAFAFRPHPERRSRSVESKDLRLHLLVILERRSRISVFVSE